MRLHVLAGALLVLAVPAHATAQSGSAELVKIGLTKKNGKFNGAIIKSGAPCLDDGAGNFCEPMFVPDFDASTLQQRAIDPGDGCDAFLLDGNLSGECATVQRFEFNESVFPPRAYFVPGTVFYALPGDDSRWPDGNIPEADVREVLMRNLEVSVNGVGVSGDLFSFVRFVDANGFIGHAFDMVLQLTSLGPQTVMVRFEQLGDYGDCPADGNTEICLKAGVIELVFPVTVSKNARVQPAATTLDARAARLNYSAGRAAR